MAASLTLDAQAVNRRLRKVPAWPLYLAGLLPLAYMVWELFTGGLGVDPVRQLEHETGLWALKFIIAGLCVTPLRRLTGVSLIKYRRAIGLVAFFYVVLHVLVWLVLDMQFLWGQIGGDILKRPFITLGMAAFVMMIPLAVTSNNRSVRKMGAAAWGRLHKLTYPVAFLGAVHFLLVVKAWPQQPMVYLAIVTVLLAMRVVWARRRTAARMA
ncbi:protein-methionine-sulfoxide reductase heme-binding subunit MsrQ [Solirhodobacter olei]|uniref:protein-methionine-sulfoxide reductase heme-binding subunit MsrQ n=1 Tax=Solirhodobacter olei TaxID=2493082 RepID=UPI000FDBB58F|nr:protein-methionine-sulfoxide reductase heme-binding subunit MsrQ [Solirhodobacter olei]